MRYQDGAASAPERREGRTKLTLGPTPEEMALLGSTEHFTDTSSAIAAQRWGLPLLRAAMPMIRREQNRLARFGDRNGRR